MVAVILTVDIVNASFANRLFAKPVKRPQTDWKSNIQKPTICITFPCCRLMVGRDHLFFFHDWNLFLSCPFPPPCSILLSHRVFFSPVLHFPLSDHRLPCFSPQTQCSHRRPPCKPQHYPPLQRSEEFSPVTSPCGLGSAPLCFLALKMQVLTRTQSHCSRKPHWMGESPNSNMTQTWVRRSGYFAEDSGW